MIKGQLNILYSPNKDGKGYTMIKIEIAEDCGTVEISGNRDDVIIAAGFALYNCIRILRECGRSDAFIKEMFMIALNHKDDEQNEQ